MKLDILTLREIWRARSGREKTLLTTLGALLGIALLYGLLWRPAATHRARLSAEIWALQSELEQMKQQEQEARRLARASSSALRHFQTGWPGLSASANNTKRALRKPRSKRSRNRGGLRWTPCCNPLNESPVPALKAFFNARFTVAAERAGSERGYGRRDAAGGVVHARGCAHHAQSRAFNCAFRLRMAWQRNADV